MKTAAYIIGFIAFIVIIAAGLSRSNNFFAHGDHLGELVYLTPAAAQSGAEVTDSAKAGETGVKDQGEISEATKNDVGIKDNSPASGKAVETKK